MIRRIGLLGAECTGKSTLADSLARRLPGFIAEEYLRDFVRDFGRAPTLADQEGIFLTQQATVATVARAAQHAQVPWVIADPLPLMTAVYSIAYFDDAHLLTQGLTDAGTYDVIGWCAPDIPWQPDPGMRDGPALRERVDAVIAREVSERVPLLRLSGSLDERLHSVLDALG